MNQQGERVHVVAAAIMDGRNRVLLGKRPLHAHQGGLWEFPGGKIEPGESPEQGLQRELQEELGITPESVQPLIRITHDYPDKSVLLDVWQVDRFSGEPAGLEGQPVRWVSLEQLRSYDFPAANLPVIKALELPELYLVTPEPAADTACFLAELERSLLQGVSLVQLRARHLSAGDYLSLVPRVLQCCNKENARLLLNADPALAVETGAAGVHLNSKRLMALSSRPLDESYLVAASCHSLQQIAHASALGLDFAVVSPVQPTRSHPGAQTLGFPGLFELTEAALLPVFALGGMQRPDLATARQYGAQGIAAIRGLWNPD